MLNDIKETSKYVVENSKYVKINYSVLEQFLNKIDCSDIKNWLTYNPYGLLNLDVESIVNFLVVFEAIDYSFWGYPKWTVSTEEGFKDGSDALLYTLLNYTKKKGTDFSKIDKNEFNNILKGNVQIPLFEERYKTIVEVSKNINDNMNGNFYQYIKNLTTDTELFETIIANFPSFKDERTYNQKTIYFYKLAQLLTSDILHIREELENINVNYSNLIGCADYKIPQTLRALGIIEYDKELSNIIDNKKEIKISSKYEVEIRASQLFIIEYIKNRLENINSIDINDFLFTYSKKVKKITKPYHLCRNTNY